ncbi:phosphate transport system protein phoU-like protein [Mycobacteroides abscessus subsp. abscessus]|uniref:phosphate signaling complex PhoU family protein n=1 Tax=Mycobacteroides abscessus TaxID=36809 RepID=UPI0009A5EB06|nr:PhoU domain-containing protein [Mycobacteroides abscessus]SKU16597.1 phosphate transport system protein phoU-like protein [Mycobacteroides abscessus subsp. abscessus]
MCGRAAGMCTTATALLLGDQSESAATLHTSLRAVSKAGRSISDHAFSLLALQAPVASELRAVVATIHIVGNIDRMAGLAANVGRMALRESPRVTLPGDVRDLVVEMSLAAGHSAQNARCAIERGDPLFARQMEQEDGRMNILHRELFEVVMQRRWPHGCAAAADLVLIGRFYERFADHAVDIARQVYFQATGDHMAPLPQSH